MGRRAARSKPYPPEEVALDALELIRDGGSSEALAVFGFNARAGGHPAHALRFLPEGVRLVAERLTSAVTVEEQRRFRRELDALRAELIDSARVAPDEELLELGVATAAVRWRAVANTGFRLNGAGHRDAALTWIARGRALAIEVGALDEFLDAFGQGALNLAFRAGDDAAAPVLAQELLERVRARRLTLDPTDPYVEARRVENASMERLAKRVLARVAARASRP